ncbi:hypothetical protein [uncultured Psychromonas sp.]|uniref:hypothetical protein n=1 Tax=uncultured Psychromonas sp. TaxID=173974 RepID=UPI00260F10CF|nr:hypothetical protein [uncultured Psychromonas sp.]
MKYHPLVLETLLRSMPSTINTVNVLNALLNGYSIKEMVADPDSFEITLKGRSLESSASRIKRFIK